MINQIQNKNQSEELESLRKLLQSSKPFVIEFSNNKNINQKTFIKICLDFLKEDNYKIKVLDGNKFTGKYEKNYITEQKGLNLSERNLLITYEINSNLLSKLSGNKDIIILDESIFNRLTWIKRLLFRKEISEEELKKYLEYYVPQINNLINYTIISYGKADFTKEISESEEHDTALYCCQYLLKGYNLLDPNDENNLNYQILVNLLPIMKSDYIKQLKLILEKKGQNNF